MSDKDSPKPKEPIPGGFFCKPWREDLPDDIPPRPIFNKHVEDICDGLSNLKKLQKLVFLGDHDFVKDDKALNIIGCTLAKLTNLRNLCFETYYSDNRLLSHMYYSIVPKFACITIDG